MDPGHEPKARQIRAADPVAGHLCSCLSLVPRDRTDATMANTHGLRRSLAYSGGREDGDAKSSADCDMTRSILDELAVAELCVLPRKHGPNAL